MKVISIDGLINIPAKIEELVGKHQIDYIDACLLYCQQHNIEIEALAASLRKSSNVKAKLAEEAAVLNLLKKTE